MGVLFKGESGAVGEVCAGGVKWIHCITFPDCDIALVNHVGDGKQNSCHRVDFDDYGKPDLSPKIKGERKNPKYPTDYIH